MVTILPAIEKRPSMGQRLSQGIGRGLEVGSQMAQQYQQKQQQVEQGKKISQLIGADVTGLDPEDAKNSASTFHAR